MMNFTNSSLSALRTRRAACGALACVPLMAFGWLQFTGGDAPVESPPSNGHAPRSVEHRLHSISNAAGNSPVDSGKIVLVSGTELSPTVDRASNSASESLSEEARLLAAIAGEWEDDYQGQRHLMVAADGTGTMVVDLDGIGKRLFAPRLTFDIEWSLANGHVTLKTLGGEPKSKVQLVLKLYGNEARYKILEMSAERMLLLDPDGKTRYDWRRPNSSADHSK